MLHRLRRRAPALLAGLPILTLVASLALPPGMAAAAPRGAVSASAPVVMAPDARFVRRLTIDSDLRRPSGLSAWAIDAYLRSQTALPALGAAFKAAEAKHGVSALYLLALAMHESGYGRSWLARHHFNLFGWHAYDRNPAAYATRFRSYADAIDYVAGQIAKDYLSRGGRYYGGAPTLRGMRHYASDPLWAPRIASIANAIALPSLGGRGITFTVKAPTEPLTVGDAATVTLAADRASALPDGLRLAGRIRLVTDDTAVPTGDADEPFALTGARSRDGVFKVKLQVGPNPGDYAMDLVLVDSDGRPLPVADAVAIPPIELRVAPLYDVTFSLESGGGLVLRAANQGEVPVPALGPELGVLAAGRQPTELTAWLLRAGDPPIALARHALPADLPVAGQWDVVVDLGGANLQPGDVLLARLEVPDATGAPEASLPAVFRVDVAPIAPGLDNADPGAGAGDDPVVLSPVQLTDPLAAAAVTLVAPPPVVGAAIAAGAPVMP
jgi:hypothetical protein